MTNYVPYIYVNLTALCCFGVLLLAFIASKKTPEIVSFIHLLVDCIIWTGASILMRFDIYPGIHMWFRISLIALFTLPYFLYEFVYRFAQLRGRTARYIIAAVTFITDLFTGFGYVLKDPHMGILSDGGIVFTYDMEWPILLIGILVFIYLLFMIKTFADIIKAKGRHFPGLQYLIASGAAMLAGNMLEILPRNIFPFDTLSGIVFAVFIMLALYRKHIFQLSLLVSRGFLIAACLTVCTIGVSIFAAPICNALVSNFNITTSQGIALTIIMFALILNVMWRMLEKVADVIFSHTADHAKLMKEFSDSISRSLDTSEIIEKMTDMIQTNVPAEHIYVCLNQEGSGYKLYAGVRKLSVKPFSISSDSPYVRYLGSRPDSYYLMSDFHTDPLYSSVWKNEKMIENELSATAVFAIRDKEEISGIVLLTGKAKNKKYTYTELNFISTAVSIASIALKNAVLYEKMYREARIDSLTDTYNYRYFAEQTVTLFNKYKKDCLALIYVDIDDFRLYNQLYGTLEGDHVLRTVASIMKQCIGENGSVYRYSGKIFAALLPHYDGRRTETLAKAIQNKLSDFNDMPERKNMKALSVSCGICISPYSASSSKELIEHADLAVFNAKNMGKDQIMQFTGSDASNMSDTDKVAHALESVDGMTDAYRENNASIHALTAAIDAKDHYTYQHSQDVAMYASALAANIGFNDSQIAMIYEGGLLHDIGKISIPETILCKTGALTDDEYSVMKSHVNNSIDIIKHLPDMEYVIPTVLGHHERWDGKGYPRGLKGEQNPLPARCLSLADTYDAMTTDRPYRKGMSSEMAADIIEKEAGKQFDPALDKVFVNMIRNGEFDNLKPIGECH